MRGKEGEDAIISTTAMHTPDIITLICGARPPISLAVLSFRFPCCYGLSRHYLIESPRQIPETDTNGIVHCCYLCRG